MAFGPLLTRRCLMLSSLAGMVAAPCSSGAQTTGKVYRLGVIQSGSPPPGPGRGPFLQRLEELGWIRDRNIVIEDRFAEGRIDRLPALVGELLRRDVDVIVANDTPAAKAAKAATRTVPIVMGVGDPVRSGLVASRARPGGNLTGVDTTLSLRAKSLQLLRELVPNASDVGYLVMPDNPVIVSVWHDLDGIAPSLGMKVLRFDVRSPKDLNSVFALMARQRISGLLVPADAAVLVPHRQTVVDLAAKTRIPAVYPWRSFVEVGGLMSHGNDQAHISRLTADYVDRILRGTTPGDLPIQEPRKFELTINLKTARTLGLTIPPSLLARADHIME